ncbi:MAG TPA: low affinity iron permease family protein [Cyclobacteriaceae bacterium]
MEKKANKNTLKCRFDRFSTKLTKATGSPTAFLIAAGAVVVWLISGPFFDFSDTWQLVINTGTTIITFLMVFMIQQAQNKDTIALQLKLNELIAAHEGASNRLINSEDLTEEELMVIKKFYIKLSELASKEIDIHMTHSIDEATENHAEKMQQRGNKKPKAVTSNK